MNSCENCMYQKQPKYCELNNKKLYGFCGNFTEGRTMITNEEARKAIEKYQKEHPLHSAMLDVTAIDSKEGVDIISQTIEKVSKKVDEDTELWCICEMAKMYMQGVRPVYTVKQEEEWTPVSKGLPNNRDWYLGVFREPDTGFIGLPYICDYVGEVTKGTTNEGWILRHCTDVDNVSDYFRNLICVAWQPLPKPYKEGGAE